MVAQCSSNNDSRNNNSSREPSHRPAAAAAAAALCALPADTTSFHLSGRQHCAPQHQQFAKILLMFEYINGTTGLGSYNFAPILKIIFEGFDSWAPFASPLVSNVSRTSSKKAKVAELSDVDLLPLIS